jgi:hypothetical protein
MSVAEPQSTIESVLLDLLRRKALDREAVPWAERSGQRSGMPLSRVARETLDVRLSRLTCRLSCGRWRRADLAPHAKSRPCLGIPVSHGELITDWLRPRPAVPGARGGGHPAPR